MPLQKNILENLYLNQRKSQRQIAEQLGCSKEVVQRHMKKFGIKTRQGREAIGAHCLVGEKFTRLTVLKEIEQGPRGHIRYVCKCDCGNQIITLRSSLLRKNTRSCGCLFREIAKQKTAGYKDIPAKWFRRAKERARWRGLCFNVTIQQIWNLYIKQNKRCALSGQPIGWESARKWTASLDRIKSDKGYTRNNVQLVTKNVNLAKHTLSQEAFIELCGQITDFNKAA